MIGQARAAADTALAFASQTTRYADRLLWAARSRPSRIAADEQITAGRRAVIRALEGLSAVPVRPI